MYSINQVLVQGRLGKDPEVVSFKDGNDVTILSIATNVYWKGKSSGEQEKKTTWHRVVARNGDGKYAAEYLKKGDVVCVQGSLVTRQVENKETGSSNKLVEISAEKLKLIMRHKAAPETFE